MVELSKEQMKIVEEILEWAKTAGAGDHRTLAGYAGTGKTTVLAYFSQSLPSWVVAAPTGKAVSVLKSKKILAFTIHQIAYRFTHNTEDGDPVFEKKISIDGEPQGVLVDEASMVNEEVFDHVMSFGLPVLFVGDHGQLPPIGKDPGVMKDPDFTLELIHRQAMGNPVIAIAHRVRCGEKPDESWTEEGAKIVRGSEQTIIARVLEEDCDIMIVPTNALRHRLNSEWRLKVLGHQGIPRPGEKVICLRNNSQKRISNGDIFNIEECYELGENGIQLYLTRDGSRYSQPIEVVAIKGLFGRQPTVDDKNQKQIELFDFGYAITCHKAQGSEWPSVFIYDRPFDDFARWRYTAITRSSERLVIQEPN